MARRERKGEGETGGRRGKKERRAGWPPRVGGRSRGRGTPSSDLIGVGRRELERSGRAREAPGAGARKSSRGGDRQPQRPANGPPSPSDRPRLLPPRDPIRPRPTTTPRSPFPPPPSLFSPHPNPAGTHSGKEERPGPARHLRRRIASRRRAPADVTPPERRPEVSATPHPTTPQRAGRSELRRFGASPGQGRGAWRSGMRAAGGCAHLGPDCALRGRPKSPLPPPSSTCRCRLQNKGTNHFQCAFIPRLLQPRLTPPTYPPTPKVGPPYLARGPPTLVHDHQLLSFPTLPSQGVICPTPFPTPKPHFALHSPCESLGAHSARVQPAHVPSLPDPGGHGSEHVPASGDLPPQCPPPLRPAATTCLLGSETWICPELFTQDAVTTVPSTPPPLKETNDPNICSWFAHSFIQEMFFEDHEIVEIYFSFLGFGSGIREEGK
ncbi:uncharacterized protein [Dasypus novemcinctus]|uniref:uncharacterized protein n=1 Tax=Dasypus novemcinctus TaxID=9361 RepID=UPI0039C9BD63